MYEVNSKQYNDFEKKNLNKDSRERERERVTRKPSYLIYGIIVVLAIALGASIAYNLQSSASAAPEQVNFNPVTIRNGAKIHVNGDKTLTAINDGKNLFADDTTDDAVKGSEIQSKLNSFANDNYGSDAITTAFSGANLISQSLLTSFHSFVPSVTSAYWLADTSDKYGVGIRGVAGSDNEQLDNTATFTGRTPNGYFFANEEVNLGSNNFYQDTTLGTFNQPANTYLYSKASTRSERLRFGFFLFI